MIASALGAPAAAAAAGARTNVAVTVTVAKKASLTVLGQPQFVLVTAADVARGYVDVPAPAQIMVRSNSEGYLLEFAPAADFIRGAVVSGLGNDIHLGPSGGSVAQRPAGSGTVTASLHFRLLLSGQVAEGRHPWPVRLSVEPL